MMRIPKSFKILGQTIRVVFTGEPFNDRDGTMGYASYRRNEVQLRPSTEVTPLSEEQLEMNFLHELLHFIVYFSGAAVSGKKDYLHQEEEFIDLTAGLLHQALSTMEYE